MEVRTSRLIEMREVTRLTSLRKTSIYEAIKRREFKPIHLGRKVVFSEAEILAWVDAHINASTKEIAQ